MYININEERGGKMSTKEGAKLAWPPQSKFN